MTDRLRTIAILALYDNGFCGPNYNLDNVKPIITYHKEIDSFNIYFWDINTNISQNNQYFNELMEYYKNNEIKN